MGTEGTASKAGGQCRNDTRFFKASCVNGGRSFAIDGVRIEVWVPARSIGTRNEADELVFRRMLSFE